MGCSDNIVCSSANEPPGLWVGEAPRAPSRVRHAIVPLQKGETQAPHSTHSEQWGGGGGGRWKCPLAEALVGEAQQYAIAFLCYQHVLESAI